MKLPFAFGINLLFRLVFPGSVLAIVLWFLFAQVAADLEPELRTALSPIFQPVPALGEVASVGMLAVFLGWLITLADMPIYMLFEGRRFWPRRLRCRMRRREHARLVRLEEAAEACWKEAQALRERLDADPPPEGERQAALALEHSEALERHLERAVQASRFPLDPKGRRYAPMPTRLGNLIYEYEMYPANKYGLDSVFFFYRLWLMVDNDMREEVDAKQAVVDGATYVAFACSLGALIGATVLLVRLALSLPGGPLSFDPAAIALDAALVVLLLVAARLVYRLSIHGHVQFGEIYKALFDQHWHRLDLDPTLELIEQRTGRPSPPKTEPLERARTAWRYLRWHRVRVDGVNVNAEEVRRGPCSSSH